MFKNGSVSHDLMEETIEAKSRWFQSLSLEERMDVFCQLTNLMLENNPKVLDKKDARPVLKDRIRLDVQTSTPGLDFNSAWERRVAMNYKGQQFFVVAREDLITSKRASGREVDLEDVRILELESSETNFEE